MAGQDWKGASAGRVRKQRPKEEERRSVGLGGLTAGMMKHERLRDNQEALDRAMTE